MAQIPEQAIAVIRKSVRPRGSLVSIRPQMSEEAARKFCEQMGWDLLVTPSSFVGLKDGRGMMYVYSTLGYVSFWSR